MQSSLHVNNERQWTLVIKPKTPLLQLHLADLWRYRDLLFLFVKRDFTATYKQTILGPLWFLIQPLLSTFMFVVIFDRIAGIPTDGIPSQLFYLSGLVVWNYFAACLNTTAVTFTNNAGLFGKVYFPRMIVPLSNVLSALIHFGIQLALLLGCILYFCLFKGLVLQLSAYVLVVPFVLLIVASLGLGFGLIISALTAKYRDLVYLVSFGVQLLMYATPVIYPVSFLKGDYKTLIMANPITPLIELFRHAVLGVGEVNPFYLLSSLFFTLVILFTGIIIFNKVEKTFMDVI